MCVKKKPATVKSPLLAAGLDLAEFLTKIAITVAHKLSKLVYSDVMMNTYGNMIRCLSSNDSRLEDLDEGTHNPIASFCRNVSNPSALSATWNGILISKELFTGKTIKLALYCKYIIIL